MNKRINFIKVILVSTALVLTFACADAVNAAPGKTWESTYDSGGNDTVNTMCVDNLRRVHVLDGFGADVNFAADGSLLGVINPDTSMISGAGFGGYDTSGNLYYGGTVVARTWACPGAGSDSDFLIVKYDATGALSTRFQYDGGSDALLSRIAVDKNGNLFIFGWTMTTSGSDSTGCTSGVRRVYGTTWNMELAGFSGDGTNRWGISSTRYLAAFSTTYLLADKSGDAILIGRASGVGSQTVGIQKYAGATGAVSWFATPSVNGTVSARPQTAAIVDDMGDVTSVLLTSSCTGCAQNNDEVAKFSGVDGSSKWSYRSGTVYNVSGLSVDRRGNVGAGGTYANPTTTVPWIARLDAATGAESWRKTYEVTDGTTSIADAEFDPNGNFCVLLMTQTCTGSRVGPVPARAPCYSSYSVIMYAGSNGTELWRVDFDSTVVDVPAELAIDDSGNIYIAGSAASCTSYQTPDQVCQDIKVFKYAQDPGTTQPRMLPAGRRTQLTLPANGAVIPAQGQDAVVAIRPTGAGEIVSKVYTTKGRLVRKSLTQEAAGDSTLLRWDGKDDDGKAVASGVYLIKVKAPGIDKIFKVVIVR